MILRKFIHGSPGFISKFPAVRISGLCPAILQTGDDVFTEVSKLFFRKLRLRQCFSVNEHVSVIIDSAVGGVQKEKNRYDEQYM